MKYILIVLVLASFLNAELRRDKSKNVVIDNENNLMWEDSVNNTKVYLSHKDAQSHCETLQYLSYSNWRLPHIDEYKNIVDKTNEINYINKAFKYNLKDWYWASTAHFRTLWFYADYMYFISGTAYFDSRFKKKYVRCIRDTK